MDNTLSKLIYEKHFLYGVRNIDSSLEKQSGDLTGFINNNPDQNTTNIYIVTDKYGFRNDDYDGDYDYILVGDSFLHQSRLNQADLLNYQLQKKNIKSYNAALSVYDVSHYFEVIKFFKKKKKFKKKFIMFMFPGNDFLFYGRPKENYHIFFDNNLFFSFLELRKFLNMHSIIKYLSLNFKEKSNYKSSKIKSYLINGKKMYFYNDYIKSNEKKISFTQEFTNLYKEFLPDLIIVIPTKFDIYCNFIEETNCYKNNYQKKIQVNDLLKNIPIVDATSFLIEKASLELKNNNFLYDFNDTHLNSVGSAYLSDFLIKNLKVEKIQN